LQDRIRVLEEEATAREKTLKEANDRIASLERTLKDMQRMLELKGAAVPPPPAVTPPPPSAETPPVAATPGPEAAKAPSEAAATTADVKPEASAPPPAPSASKPDATVAAPPPPLPSAEWWEDPALLGAALAGLGVLGGVGFLLARRRRAGAEADAFGAEPTFRAPAAPAAAAAAVASSEHTAEIAPATAVATALPAGDDVDPIQEADVYIAYGRDAQAEEILKEALAKNPVRQDIKLKLLEIYAARRSKNEFNALATDLHGATQGQGDLWLKVATMGFALDPDNVLYAAGKDSASLPQVGVATDVNLDFDLDMVTAAGAPTTVSDNPLDPDQNVKTMTLSPERMDALRAEGAAAARSAADTQAIVPDIDVIDVQPAPQTDVTLQPVRSGPITDINLDFPQSVTTSNVIDFEFDPSKTMRIEPDAVAAFAPEKTVVISPENQEQARDLSVEIDLGALDSRSTEKLPEAPPTIAGETPQEIAFDFELPSDSPPTAEMDVPPTDIKLDVLETRSPAQTPNMDFALDTVSLDLGRLERTSVPEEPVRDDHWYDVQTKFDLAKAYQEMGDKDGAREILSEVIKEGDAQQKAEADDLMAKLS
jgi:pilus assembly protein FimV